ncbi:H-NS family nucleoid-associated regulatory protein [Leisingera sp. ANG59]|uniref:H-NS histone family protein n=1 Tax=Leisingera sp. ANG59 TaxID=2675221 RepID=UPI0015728540|nr:H-NS histone family protein [Leisingera sp. ANG59]NSY37533.1 H-NS histone family protein [Leisingera sp. ANG59]
MTEIDLSSFTLDELKTLQKDVEKAIKTFEERKRKEALAAVQEKAAEMGFALDDLVEGVKTKKAKKSVPPKYRHPENPELTWTGRGRKPDWFKAALEAGAKPEDLEI